MTNKNQVSQPRRSRGLTFVLAFFATLLAGQASADVYEDIDLSSAKACHSQLRTYGAKPGETINEEINVSNGGDPVFWARENDAGCIAGNDVLDCGGGTPARYHVQVPDTDTEQPDSTFATVTSQSLTAADPTVKFRVRASDAGNPLTTCEQKYELHMVPAAAIGGWGDPHLTTFDGTHYDFQSAGEFTALRSEPLELQTRQTAVPTATVPITNEYTGITHCVAVYTAVAARVGKTRVTLQPRSGEHDRKSMQLRVNGNPVALTESGIVLSSGGDEPNAKKQFDGRIKQADGGAVEIVAADGAQIVLTPAHWDAHNIWYVNIKVYQSSARAGTMGVIPEGTWLPLLPDGTSLGPKPESEDERYQQLYETFADAWRVTDATSLFYYKDEAGTNTATFTLDEWPRNHPESCGIEGQTPAQPTTNEAAEQACAAVTDPAEKADCIFDISITGNLGFGKSYEVMQSFKPQGPGWQTQVVFPPTSGTEPPTPPGGIPWWVWILILILILIIWIVRKKKGP